MSSKILSPLLAIRLTWQFTSMFSENTSYKLVKDNYEKVLNGLKQLASEADEKYSNKKSEEVQYVQTAIPIIKSSLRTLQIIIDGRNLNFKEEDELRQKSQEKINNFSTFSKNLQSIIPRLGSATVAGAAGGIPIATIINDALTELAGLSADFATLIFSLTIAGVAGIGYVVNGLVITPYIIKKTQKEKIRADYNRNLYFEQYVDKSVTVLVDLYKQIHDLHNSIFSQKIPDIPQKEVIQLVEDLVSGARGHMCEYVHKHMAKDSGYDIDDNLWALCESSQGVEHCKYFIEEKRLESRNT